MSTSDPDRLPHLRTPTPAESLQVQRICGTVAEFMTDANELVRKAVVSALLKHYGSLEQYSQDQITAFKTNYRQKRFNKTPKRKSTWDAR